MLNLLSVKYEQSSTPRFHQKNNLASRKLWGKESTKETYHRENWSSHRSTKNEPWDGIGAPQFIDFNDIPETRDSFFNATVIASTPLPECNRPTNLPQDTTDVLIESLNNVSVSERQKENSTATKKEKNIIIKLNGKTVDDENYVVHNPKQKLEEVKPKPFKANPLPKFFKSRIPSEKIKNEDKKVEQKTKDTEKPQKENIEVWKRDPFVPRPCTKIREIPKTPPLRTAIRAKERKRFDEGLKEKEKEQERRRQLEEMKKKRQEQEEIAQLRKKTVHKAQPVPKYKSNLPKIQKRPLTDPISPRLLKRRRHA